MSLLVTVINTLTAMPPEAMWFVQVLCCYALLLMMLRFFGAPGLYVFMAIALIAANIGVLKIVQFKLFPAPIALGTTFIAANYLATDILTEYFGFKCAKRGIFLGFAAVLLILCFMLLLMGFHPITVVQATHAGVPGASVIQKDLMTLFLPMPALLLASLSSYLVSQFSDAGIFLAVKKLTGQRLLWLRNNVSTLLAALFDAVVFNVLAWKIFALHPVPWHTLLFTYILGTYVMRVVLSVLDTPFIYIAKRCIPEWAKR